MSTCPYGHGVFSAVTSSPWSGWFSIFSLSFISWSKYFLHARHDRSWVKHCWRNTAGFIFVFLPNYFFSDPTKSSIKRVFFLIRCKALTFNFKFQFLKSLDRLCQTVSGFEFAFGLVISKSRLKKKLEITAGVSYFSR